MQRAPRGRMDPRLTPAGGPATLATMPTPRTLRHAFLVLTAAGSAACGGGGGGGSASATEATSVTTAPASTSGADTSTGVGSSEGGSESAGASSTTGAPDPTTGTPDPSTGPELTTTGAIDGTTTDDSATSWFETTVDPDMCKQNIDLVFVMDVSTSMAGVLQKLENEILVVDQAIKALELNSEVRYGLVVFVDDAKIINNGAPYADVQALKNDFNFYWNFTQSNQQANGGGSNGDWPENTIDALYLAAFVFQWRPVEDTLRMIIHTTDDTFGDKGAVQSGIAVQHSYDETVLGLQERQIRVFSFADDDKTGGPGNNEDVSMGFFTPYDGKTPIPEATDGGAFNINLVNSDQLSLSAAINMSVEESLCMQYIPQ